MSNILPFRGKYHSERIAESIFEKELERGLEAAVRDYDQMQADINAAYYNLLIKPYESAIDTGTAANEEIT